MAFSGMNYLAVLVAAAAGFATGAVWYGLFGRRWAAALGKVPEDMKPTAFPFIVAFAAEILMAFILAGLIGHIGTANVFNGAVSGLLVWAGFVATTVSVNNAYQNTPVALPLIDAGHWLAVLVVMGLVIGAFSA
ncbi:MAG: DUF1761 domain-containing protein [Rhodobiaceae bacterium]|nr:DUF1761 domain-containing protein [Rhodobiaceae bacterium]MCC0016184.1 DUF1761 domain-containing protein [Rhodobiaceae bacterium]MCC0041211.1 DUF1761 domain-containing protein [Rhodobiaceae bacterium]